MEFDDYVNVSKTFGYGIKILSLFLFQMFWRRAIVSGFLIKIL